MVTAAPLGVFDSGLYDVDSGLAYATIETTQRLFAMDTVVSAVHAKTTDPYRAFEIKA